MNETRHTGPVALLLWGLILGLMLTLPAVGSCRAGEQKFQDPAEMLAAAQAEARRLDPKARLIVAAYRLGGIGGGFKEAVMVYLSPRLKGTYNCYQIGVRRGKARLLTRLRMKPPKGDIPDPRPEPALKLARSWILAHWWRGQTEPYMDLILRPRRPKERLPYSVRWVWVARAISQEEDCKVYLDAVKMRCLRAVIDKAPDATPPPAEHFKKY